MLKYAVPAVLLIFFMEAISAQNPTDRLTIDDIKKNVCDQSFYNSGKSAQDLNEAVQFFSSYGNLLTGKYQKCLQRLQEFANLKSQ